MHEQYIALRDTPLLVECKDIKFHAIFMRSSVQISHYLSVLQVCVQGSCANLLIYNQKFRSILVSLEKKYLEI